MSTPFSLDIHITDNDDNNNVYVVNGTVTGKKVSVEEVLKQVEDTGEDATCVPAEEEVAKRILKDYMKQIRLHALSIPK